MMPVNFNGTSIASTKRELKLTKARDNNKNKLIKNHKSEINYFIRISYKDKINIENIKKILIYNGVEL